MGASARRYYLPGVCVELYVKHDLGNLTKLGYGGTFGIASRKNTVTATRFYEEVLRNYGGGDGRASRSEYWYFNLVYLIIVLCGSVVSRVLEAVGLSIVGTILMVGIVGVHIIPSWRVAVRRLHDTGRSGRWLLMPVLSGVASIVLGIFVLFSDQGFWLAIAMFVMLLATIGCGVVVIVFLAQRSVDGNNDYGRPPRALEQL